MTYALEVEVSDIEKKLLDQCVAKSGVSSERFIHNAVIEKLEDTYDLILLSKAMAEDKQNSCVGYTIEEAGRILGLR